MILHIAIFALGVGATSAVRAVAAALQRRRELRQRGEAIAAEWRDYVAEHPGVDTEAITVELRVPPQAA